MSIETIVMIIEDVLRNYKTDLKKLDKEGKLDHLCNKHNINKEDLFKELLKKGIK